MSNDINVGAISEALNNKVDLNQMNTNAQGLSYGSSWGMPSSRYTNLTFGATGTTYTAPVNGWFQATASANSEDFIFLELINQTTGINMGHVAKSLFVGNVLRSFVPARKNDIVQLLHTNLKNTSLIFIYAEGEQ